MHGGYRLTELDGRTTIRRREGGYGSWLLINVLAQRCSVGQEKWEWRGRPAAGVCEGGRGGISSAVIRQLLCKAS